MDNPRSRNWCLVLYPEDETHKNCIENLLKGSYNYAAILHDKDTWLADESPDHVEGELKKPHWHVVLVCGNARYRNGLAEELGIKPNYLEVCRGRDTALLYLVHDGYPEKYQYDIDDCFGSLVPNLEKLLVCQDEGEKVKTIVSMIDSAPGKLSYRSILLKACDNGLYGEFRRLGSGIKYLLDEHNEQFFEDDYLRMNRQLYQERFRDYEKYVKGGG